MTEDLSWAPPGIDVGSASSARVYDYWLGGTHNFQSDRDAARAFIAVEPNIRAITRQNRAFLARAVRMLTASGIRQFLDIGSGIPTQGNVHEVAQAAVPGARVVYVDVDPVAVAHSRAILAGNPDAAVLQADLRNPEEILASQEVRRLLDLEEPLGLLMGLVLHFVPDEEDPWRTVGTFRDACPPGSHLVISHGTSADRSAGRTEAAVQAYNRTVAARGTARSRAAIERFFDGFTVLDPGLVQLPEWRPDPAADVPAGVDLSLVLAGVGRRP